MQHCSFNFSGLRIHCNLSMPPLITSSHHRRHKTRRVPTLLQSTATEPPEPSQNPLKANKQTPLYSSFYSFKDYRPLKPSTIRSADKVSQITKPALSYPLATPNLNCRNPKSITRKQSVTKCQYHYLVDFPKTKNLRLLQLLDQPKNHHRNSYPQSIHKIYLHT